VLNDRLDSRVFHVIAVKDGDSGCVPSDLVDRRGASSGRGVISFMSSSGVCSCSFRVFMILLFAGQTQAQTISRSEGRVKSSKEAGAAIEGHPSGSRTGPGVVMRVLEGSETDDEE
jgi:hypothetical protein